MSFGTRLGMDTLKSLAAGSISGTFAPLADSSSNSALAAPARFIMVENGTNARLTFSDTGVSGSDKFTLPAGGTLILDLCSNQIQPEGLRMAQGASLYVKLTSGAAATGAAYFSSFYAVGD